MQEELDKVTVRNFPISLNNIRVIAVNVVEAQHRQRRSAPLTSGASKEWKARVQKAGAAEWQVVNDLDHLDRILTRS